VRLVYENNRSSPMDILEYQRRFIIYTIEYDSKYLEYDNFIENK